MNGCTNELTCFYASVISVTTVTRTHTIRDTLAEKNSMKHQMQSEKSSAIYSRNHQFIICVTYVLIVYS